MKMISDTMPHCRIKPKIYSEEGVAPLVSMVIISAAALIIVANLAYIGHGEMEASLASQKGVEASDIANSCAEDVLARLRDDPDYASTTLLLSVGDGSCTISLAASSTQKIISIKSQAGDYYKIIRLTAGISSTGIEIYDWKEY